MQYAQLLLVALAGFQGVLACGEHKIVQPLQPKPRNAVEYRAQPLLGDLDNLVLSARGLLKTSSDGSCGMSSTCKGSKFGPCCSRDGWCGSSEASCGEGCREAFGECASSARVAARDETASACDAPTTTDAPAPATTTTTAVAPPATTPTTPAPAPALTPSKNGKCGAASAQTCAGTSIFIGPCCSKSGSCGLICLKALGCQPAYGRCI